MHVTRRQRIQLASFVKARADEGCHCTVYLQRHKQHVLLATEYEYGLSRLVIEPDGNLQHLGAGPVDQGKWHEIEEIPCA